MRWDRGAGRRSTSWSRSNHHVELYWFPHTDRLLPSATTAPSTTPSRCRGSAAGSTTSCSPTASFGGVNRLGNAVPGADPADQPASRPGAERAPLQRRPAPGLHLAARRGLPRDGVRACPARAGCRRSRRPRARRRSRLADRLPGRGPAAPADDIPLSTAHGRDSVYLAFHTNAQTDHRAYFRGSRTSCGSYDGRPHWGKPHTRTAADLAPAYPRWQDFQAIRDRLDPDRVFTNPYLDRVLGYPVEASVSTQTLAGPLGSGACQPAPQGEHPEAEADRRRPGSATTHSGRPHPLRARPSAAPASAGVA